ncbi:hypothetical protein [Bradyrhizobium yuanmingense]|uniref:hypothetical protein n=1 Tax=Bradyrhizobium yuanmingense TaxID=108015 RepID=UPI0023BA070B|nr:hypothetical protein [Bradyrhizobium yuanmingense]MDF0497322.1 hypothetical protein [Bradyrhizobium yuanmingense]
MSAKLLDLSQSKAWLDPFSANSVAVRSGRLGQRANWNFAGRQAFKRGMQTFSSVFIASTPARINGNGANRRGFEQVSPADYMEKEALPGLICQRHQNPAAFEGDRARGGMDG